MAATPAETKALVVERVRHASSTSGIEADFLRPVFEDIFGDLDSHRQSTPLMSMALSVEALSDVAIGPPDGIQNSRCWSQWFNRVAEYDLAQEALEPQAVAEAAEQVTRDLTDTGAPERIILDIQAGVMASVTWWLISQIGNSDELSWTSHGAEQLFRLYRARYDFDAATIHRLLAGQHDALHNPIKVAFSFFAGSINSDERAIHTALSATDISEHSFPLAAAKIIGYSLIAAPPARELANPDSATMEACRTSLRIWEAHGAGTHYFRAAAGMAAITRDSDRLRREIATAISLLAADGRAHTAESMELIRLRTELLERIRFADEIASVQSIRDDADRALQVARESANQIPTMVGLFSAVIALVVGSAEIAQGESARDRILVVAALGTVLLAFVLALGAVLRYISATSISLLRGSLVIGAGVAVTGVLLLALYLLA